MKTDFIARLNNLWRVSFSFRTYKKMFPASTVLSALVLWPFLLLSLILSGFYYLYAFFLKIASVPIDFLTSVVHSEGKEVKHATQAIIYFVGFPFIFMMYILMAFFAINLVLLYFAISVSNYLWTIKGFKLKPFVLEGDCEELPDGRVTFAETIKAGVFGLTTSELYGIAAILLIIAAIPVPELDAARLPLLIAGASLFGFTNLFSLVIYLAGISLKGLLAPKKEEQPKVETPVVEEPVQPEVVEEPTVEPVEEPKVVEPKLPKEKPEFLKRNKIKYSALGNKLRLINIIGAGLAVLGIVIAVIVTFADRQFQSSSYENLCVWDYIAGYGSMYNMASVPLDSSHIINLISALILGLAATVTNLILTLTLKPKKNVGTLVRNLIVSSVLIAVMSLADNAMTLYIFNPFLITGAFLVLVAVLSWNMISSILGFFNVLKIYDRDEEELPTEETNVEPEVVE